MGELIDILKALETLPSSMEMDKFTDDADVTDEAVQETMSMMVV